MTELSESLKQRLVAVIDIDNVIKNIIKKKQLIIDKHKDNIADIQSSTTIILNEIENVKSNNALIEEEKSTEIQYLQEVVLQGSVNVANAENDIKRLESHIEILKLPNTKEWMLERRLEAITDQFKSQEDLEVIVNKKEIEMKWEQSEKESQYQVDSLLESSTDPDKTIN